MVLNKLIKRPKAESSSPAPIRPLPSQTRSSPSSLGLGSTSAIHGSNLPTGAMNTELVAPRASITLRSFWGDSDSEYGDASRAVSNTMRMALTSDGSGGSTSSPSASALSSSNSSPEFHKSTPTPFVRYPPRTRTEQYWAARALTAETLLVTKKEHYQDMRIATDSSEMKRVTEITQLTKMYDERQMKLEKWLVTLLGVLLIFSFVVLISHISLAHTGIRGKKASWTHFTIPILSPFASVVEHETSVVGSKTIVGISLVLAGLAYVSLRFWMSRHQAVTVLK